MTAAWIIGGGKGNPYCIVRRGRSWRSIEANDTVPEAAAKKVSGTVHSVIIAFLGEVGIFAIRNDRFLTPFSSQ